MGRNSKTEPMWPGARIDVEIPIATAKIADHRDADLGCRLRVRDLESGPNQSVHVSRVPLEPPSPVRPRAPQAAKLGEKAVARTGLEQPSERRGTLGVRLGIELDDRDRELPVDEILGTSSRSNLPCVREAGSFSKRLLVEDERTAAWLFGSRFCAHCR